MILMRLRSGDSFRASYAPWDDFWYNPTTGLNGGGGMRVSPETALTLSAFWCAVTNKACDFASVPALFYERLERGRERATDHRLYRVLRWQPNRFQTAFEYFEMLSAHLDLRGNFYAEIVEDRGGQIAELIPRHPDRVTPEMLPNGRRQYVWRQPHGEPRIIPQERMHHICGLSSDGLKGLSVIEYGARSLGIAMAADTFSGNFFQYGAAPAFYVKHPQTLGPKATRTLQQSISSYVSGLKNHHGVLVLEEGMDAGTLGIKPQEAQLLEARVFGIEEIARWTDMPLHRLKVNKAGAVSYASVEMFDIEYVMHTLRPRAVRVEQAIWRDLLSDREQLTHYPEFLLEALLRGDSAARAAFYKSGIESQWLTPNEVRERENLNPVPWGDKPVETKPSRAEGDPRDPKGRPRSDADVRARLIALEAAARVVQKEMATATKAAQKFASDAQGWAAWCEAFYDDHVGFLSHVLKMPSHAARLYAAQQRDALVKQGIPAMSDWETRVVPQLAALAVGDEEQAA
jgi:HK97 family phage portal protein